MRATRTTGSLGARVLGCTGVWEQGDFSLAPTLPSTHAPFHPRSPAPRLPGFHAQKGQTMAEFAIVMPVLILLLFGMTLAAFYAFRAASADWGVFITGVATGAYDTPATEQARKTVLWPDIQDSISTTQSTSDRMVRSQITIEDSRPWVYGINLVETHRGTAVFRLWRFYPGPPTGEFE